MRQCALLYSHALSVTCEGDSSCPLQPLSGLNRAVGFSMDFEFIISYLLTDCYNILSPIEHYTINAHM